MWKNKPKNIEDYVGFIYCITNKLNGRKYIGKKLYWKTIKRKPLKGKKNKRHEIVSSDWKDYWGSSNSLLEDIEKLGSKNFERKILKSFKSKWECAYYEAKMQFDLGVLLSDEYYNGIINIRLGKKR